MIYDIIIGILILIILWRSRPPKKSNYSSLILSVDKKMGHSVADLSWQATRLAVELEVNLYNKEWELEFRPDGTILDWKTGKTIDYYKLQ